MSNSKLAPTILPTLIDHPRTNLVPWKLAINRAARGVFAKWDALGFLFAVCDDALWALLLFLPSSRQEQRVRSSRREQRVCHSAAARDSSPLRLSPRPRHRRHWPHHRNSL